MSKITRVTHTIFGGSAPAAANGIAQFGSKQAGTPTYTTNIATLQALAAWLNGLGSSVVSGKVPPLEELNAAFLEPSYQIGYLLEMGIPEYDAGTTYYTNSICQSSGLVYQSLVDNNLGNTPASSPTDWSLLVQGLQNYWCSLSGGTSTAMTLTIPYFSSYQPGQKITFIAGSNNGTTATININGLGAINLVDMTGAFLHANAIQNNDRVTGTIIEVLGTFTFMLPIRMASFGSYYGLDSGTANVMSVSVPIFDSSSNFQLFTIPAHTNTGATTLTIPNASIGSPAVVTKAGNALSGGELVAGTLYLLCFDGTSFRIMV